MDDAVAMRIPTIALTLNAGLAVRIMMVVLSTKDADSVRIPIIIQSLEVAGGVKTVMITLIVKVASWRSEGAHEYQTIGSHGRKTTPNQRGSAFDRATALKWRANTRRNLTTCL
jgi:hypothetical protein